jgi:hypothetical protein
VELPGADDLYWVGDTGAMLDETGEFLTAIRRMRHSDRTLATILFADISERRGACPPEMIVSGGICLQARTSTA